MAIDKSRTSPAMKAVLIVLIVAFVFSFIGISAAGLFTGGGSSNTNTGTGASSTATNTPEAIDARFQPQIAALTTAAQSEPESYTALVNLGNTYFDWAIEKQQLSTTATSAVGLDAPLWLSAKDAYARAIKINGNDSPVRVDYSITLYFSGDVKSAIETAEAVRKDDPTFSPAPFNLGIFYSSAGDKAKAIAAFQEYLKLDPQGQKGGNPAYAKEQIAALQK